MRPNKGEQMSKTKDCIKAKKLFDFFKEYEHYIKEALDEADRFLGQYVRTTVDELITTKEINFQDYISFIDSLLNCEMSSAQLDLIKGLQEDIKTLIVE